MTPLVWVDVETTGLDPHTDSLLEVGLAITDADLNVTGVISRVIAPTRKLLEHADDVVREMHHKSGLADDLRDGWALALREVEPELVAWLGTKVVPREAPMCGSSVGFDRAFLAEHMPSLAGLFHYRSIDVSTVKELVERWYPDGPVAPEKVGLHRALPDIQDSIGLLRFYREQFFLPVVDGDGARA